MRARTATIIAAIALLLPAVGAMAATTTTTTSTTARCSYEKCGAIMQGITLACADAGSCQIADFTIVLGNIGNYILGVIGALVFLMYVIGGMYMLASGGNSSRVEKGKKYMTDATIGLAIVFFGFAGVWTLRNALEPGGKNATAPVLYVCDGSLESINKPCGTNEICTEQGFCTSMCETFNLDTTLEERGGSNFTCMDAEQAKDPYGGTILDPCQPGLCPGELVCCALHPPLEIDIPITPP